MSDSTPLMSQYREIKSRHDDCILLFRVGDFYETFYEDAVDIAAILNITLTTRDKNKPNPIPLAGVPFHAAETYITRLLAAGRKVAVCEQVEDPSEAKGLVRRDVVEILTPGTALNAQLIADADNNYCLGVHPSGNGAMAVALMDVGTGECACGEAESDAWLHLIQGKKIRELVVPATHADRLERTLLPHLGRPFLTRLADEAFDESQAREALREQFGAAASEVTGALTPGETAVTGALLRHCLRLRGGSLPQVVGVTRLTSAPFLSLDEETIANLELFEPLRGGVESATLLRTLDHTLTPMGARALRHWIQRPLCDVARIDQRLDAVASVYRSAGTGEALVRALKGIADVQRLGARIASRKAIPRELHALRESLEKVPALREAVSVTGSELLERAGEALGDHAALCGMIERAVVPDPPSHLREGGVIRHGYDADLDTLIEESEAAKRWIAGLEARERERSGVATLKVGYNKVFGYFIELSNANAKSAPDDYVEKQTLVGSRRYFTPELKAREDLILSTEERRVREEQRVFDGLCASIAERAEALQRTAEAMATIDAVQSLATAARVNGYRRPLVDESLHLEIVGGRHPVLERVVSEAFVPNDLDLDIERRQFALITGPNMSGKSTFLRQTALIVVMAQLGSFVPAERARVGLVDRVFTRVGASDRLSRGESTFLVEMNETATILRHMSNRSLVVLDEVGRGTSTYDGLSIAWAITEYLLQGAVARPRTLFATHFHELTQLKSNYPRLINLKIAIREWEGGIVFLRKIVAGTSDRSFGIHAARVAGLPPAVIKRAEEILHSLELRRNLVARGLDPRDGLDQMSLFSAPAAASTDAPARGDRARDTARDPVRDTARDPVRESLAGFDFDGSTPLEALQFIRDLKDRLDA